MKGSETWRIETFQEFSGTPELLDRSHSCIEIIGNTLKIFQK